MKHLVFFFYSFSLLISIWLKKLSVSKLIILIALNDIFPMKPSNIDPSLSVESYDENTEENIRNLYNIDNRIGSRLSKISILNFHWTILRFDSRLCKNFTSQYSVSVGTTRFISNSFGTVEGASLCSEQAPSAPALCFARNNK